MSNPKILLAALLLGAHTAGAANDATYSNPVINQSAPDPTVIRADDGYYLSLIHI